MIVSIGEIVWDIFDDKKILGGAPLNVAYHLSTLGCDTQLISRIGTDDLAPLTLEKIADTGLSIDTVQQDGQLPTGKVVVSVGPNNEPSFDIVAPAAWDAIAPQEFAHCLKQNSFHLIFGTLAQRASQSRAAIRSLWEKADLKFYDVNLRPPFTSRETVLDSLAVADVTKLNDAELHQVADWSGIQAGTLQERSRKLFEKWNLLTLAVTLGEAGALLVSRDGLFEHPGFPAEVADTVGAGDAFFATLIEGILNKRPWQECLSRANQRGAFVAGQPGATPPMSDFQFQSSHR
ncbi:MAG: carbohydrate kinase [Desulfobulbaceae bacterium]|nr:carbohydrate kinase [Desulfobulbaceae bacterium]